MGEGLLLELSWLDGSVSIVLPWRKVVEVSSLLRCLFNHVEARNFIVSYECLAQVCFHSVL